MDNPYQQMEQIHPIQMKEDKYVSKKTKIKVESLLQLIEMTKNYKKEEKVLRKRKAIQNFKMIRNQTRILSIASKKITINNNMEILGLNQVLILQTMMLK